MVYMGSKSRIVGDIKPYIQDCIDENGCREYIEPFVGGANVITEIRAPLRVGYDTMRPLIALLNAMRDDPSLRFAPDDVDFELFKRMRSEYQNPTGDYSEAFVAAVGYFAGYAGRFFDGGFSRSRNKPRNHYKERLRNAQRHAQEFKGIAFNNCDYSESTAHSTTRAMIYCDPPYRGTKQYGYKNDRGEFDYDGFYNWCRKEGKRNFVLISEYDMPMDFHMVWTKPVQVALKPDRKTVDYKMECLFTPTGGLYDEWISKRAKAENFELKA